MLFVIGGALLHVINLATGGDCAGFADPAHFQWVTDAWRAVVAPNQVLFASRGCKGPLWTPGPLDDGWAPLEGRRARGRVLRWLLRRF